MRERVCNNCGGKKYKVVGQNMVKCMFCGSLYVDENSSKEEEVLIALANELSRGFRFDEAVEQFKNIIEQYPLSFQGYFGKALAKNQIVLFTNKRGTSRRPRFFADSIPSLSSDSDFLKAVELAPPEEAKSYTDLAKRVDRIKRTYEMSSSKQLYDVIFCTAGDENPQIHNNIAELLNKLELSYYNLFLQTKENEEDTFRALETSKMLILQLNSLTDLGVFRHIIERYNLRISKKQKTSTSLILIVDVKKIKKEQLPPTLQNCKSVFDINSVSLLQDLETLVKTEEKNAAIETAKIETINLKRVNPKKKEYANVESISPNELGHYSVENVEVSSEGKTKWLFLALKNGDFQTADKILDETLEENPYSSELLFARLLCDKKIRTEDEFFEKLSNFSDREQISNILRYASKNFAEDFVERWEKLVMQQDSAEFYNQFLLELASYKTPSREDFISAAENKAIETLDSELVQKVVKCFDKEDVDRFINFYFSLAQKSDDKDYYNKILELDAGHEQSNLAILMRNFKSTKDILTYRDRQQLEDTLKYMNQNARDAFVSAVISKIMPVVFFDLQEAQAQIDFYLSYMSDGEKLGALCKDIAEKFQAWRYFKPAEKYMTIAISKCADKVELYWQLIKIKCHCRTDQELVTSKAKADTLPEWETLLELGDDEHDEFYAGVVSRANLYQGERSEFVPDDYDKKGIMDRLNDFLMRNQKILLEIEKQEGLKAKKGVDYYRLQLKPLEQNLQEIQKCRDYDQFEDVVSRVKTRLSALDLSLDTSVSVLSVMGREPSLKTINVEPEKKGIKTREDVLENARRRMVLLKFLCIFLEFFPLAFSSLLLIVSLFSPKQVYLYFNETFLIVTMIYSVCIAIGNFTFYVLKKSVLEKRNARAFLTLFGLGLTNVILFVLSFYLVPNTMKINNEKEFSTLLHNAGHYSFVLEKDLDMKDRTWKSIKLYGSLNGNGHTISGLKTALLKENVGTVENLNIVIDATSQKYSIFGGLAQINSGEIENCTVNGNVNLTNAKVVGGIVGKNVGEIKNCASGVTIILTVEKDVTVGGIVGQNTSEKKNALIWQSSYVGQINVQAASGNVVVGGALAKDSSKNNAVKEVFSNAQINVTGQAKNVVAGGLIGEGQFSSQNNYAVGSITAEGKQGYVGGLYGRYTHATADAVQHSYCQVSISTTLKNGQIIGQLSGRMQYCYAIANDGNVCGEIGGFGGEQNCEIINAPYDAKFGFDEEVWLLQTGQAPILKWQLPSEE